MCMQQETDTSNRLARVHGLVALRTVIRAGDAILTELSFALTISTTYQQATEIGQQRSGGDGRTRQGVE
jgi:hypothetical protein